MKYNSYNNNCGFEGYIEPTDGSWIAFINNDSMTLFNNRDRAGAVIGDGITIQL